MPSAAAGVQVCHLRRVCPLGLMEQYLSPVAELVNDHDLSRAVVVDGAIGQVPPPTSDPRYLPTSYPYYLPTSYPHYTYPPLTHHVPTPYPRPTHALPRPTHRMSTVCPRSTHHQVAGRERLLELLREHISEHVIRLSARGAQYFKQDLGIPQGSILSALLCNVYYAQVKHKKKDVVY